jgi:PAS domain S-box-containing protein
MTTDEDEDALVRSVALQNVASILAARVRAEQDLIESKQALERKTEELLQANGRLTLLARVAGDLILADAPKEHLKAAFDSIAAEMEAEYYFHYNVADSAPNALLLVSSQGLHPRQEGALRQVARALSLCGQVAESRRPLVLESAQLHDHDRAATLRSLGVESYVGVPLLAHGHLFGTIAFASTSKTRFSESEVGLVRTLADQCAATLERSRLVDNLRDSETRYHIALTAGRAGTWETDYVSGARTWSPEGMALFGLVLADGRGRVDGDVDEFEAAVHPDDRHVVRRLRELEDKEDSFAAEYRVARPDGSILWLSGRGQVTARGADGKAQRTVSIMVDITERKRTEEHIRFLMREISHRSKNLLSVIQAIAGQTGRTAGTIEEFEARFNQRLYGLAASHDILVDQGWRGAPLADLARLQLAPFIETDSSCLVIEGPEVIVTAQAAQALGLAFHELATNAVKYGALSTKTGKVKVVWRFDEDAERPLRLSWVEESGPTVAAPSRKGFGHVVLEHIVASSVDGRVTMDFAPNGLQWTVLIPRANLVTTNSEDTVAAANL